jgi:hypothetical protein
VSNAPASSESERESGSPEAPTPPYGTAPAPGSGPAGDAPEGASDQDPLVVAAEEGSISAGESGRAVDASDAGPGRSEVEVIIGEIPDAHDISVMRWTARCTNGDHDLLGYFDSEQAARNAKEEHLASQH